MKAGVTTGEERKIVFKDVPTPKVRPGTLLLKVKYCSICGSDLEYLDGTSERLRGPLFGLHPGAILGHEFSAGVVKVGEGVEGWSVGDRVTIDRKGGGACGQCYYCRRGWRNLCVGKGSPRALRGTVYGGTEGAFAEYLVRPPTAIQKVPDSVSDVEAALVEPLATSLGAVQSGQLGLGDSTVIMGAGKIGLGAILGAKAAGAAPIIVTDVVKDRLELALKMGADVALNAMEVDVVSEVIKITEAGPDAVLICAGGLKGGDILNQAIGMVRHNGIVVITGHLPPTEVNASPWTNTRIKIAGSVSLPVSVGLRLMEYKRIDVKPMISAIVPLRDVQMAFDSMYSRENIGVLLKP